MGKILLIEDEAGIRRTLTVTLMQEGWEVEPCEDGLTGLARVENHMSQGKALDAVILDIYLPDINGLKVLKFLKEKHPEIPVIMISGFGDEATLEEIKLRKGDGYLEKPVMTDKLDEYLKSILARKDEILGGASRTPAEKDTTTRSAYAFVRIRDEESFLPVFQQLYFHSNVMYCDAVRGEFDIVLLLHGRSGEELESASAEVAKLEGVGAVELSAVEMPVLSQDLTKVMRDMEKFLLNADHTRHAKSAVDYGVCSAYAFIEIEPGAFERVYRQLYFADSVIACDCVRGRYQLCLLLKAQSFAEIDEFVTGSVARLDGVLRVTKCDIIRLLEM